MENFRVNLVYIRKSTALYLLQEKVESTVNLKWPFTSSQDQRSHV